MVKVQEKQIIGKIIKDKIKTKTAILFSYSILSFKCEMLLGVLIGMCTKRPPGHNLYVWCQEEKKDIFVFFFSVWCQTFSSLILEVLRVISISYHNVC